MPCVDENAAAALLDDCLPAHEARTLREHAAECDSCRQLVAELAKAATATSGKPLPGATPHAWSRGELVGRYVVLGRIGEGGMGVVHLAYDPDLDRRVALKVLRDAGAGSDELASRHRQRLRREAQAVAKLSHPNVVSVYDVGTADGELYVAMEYVEGATLRDWLAAERRDWQHVVDAFVEAGRGLAAAHAAGIVHRDFKPDNAIVASDGRVRVLDFGLATRDELAEAPSIGRGALAATLPHGGTPRYMAPEQVASPAQAGPAADQFSFCVALYEALYGQHPFERAPAPSGPRAPHRLAKIVRRGLAADPSARYPSMPALLADLSRAKRTRAIVAITAIGGLAIGALLLGAVHFTQRGVEPCGGAGEALAQTWNERAKVAARDAFLGTHLPYAQFAWAHAEVTLDRYGRDWTAMRTDTCKATAVRKEQSEHVMDLRMSCLAQRRSELGAVAALFARADNQTVERSVEVLATLSPLAHCADVEALQATMPPPGDLVTKVRVDAVRSQLAASKALVRSAKYKQALAPTTAALAAARSIAYEPLVVEARLHLGRLEHVLGDKAAESTLTEAFLAAQAAGHDAAAAEAARLLIKRVGIAGGRPKEGALWARLARVLAARTSDSSEQTAAEYGAGELLIVQGHYDEALAALRHALANIQQSGQASHVEHNLAALHRAIGIALGHQGTHDEALAEFRRALAIEQKLVGPDHPNIATSLGNIGATLAQQGKLADALDAHRRALAINEKVYGPEDLDVAINRLNIGSTLGDMGEYEAALAELRRGVAIMEKTAGPMHPHVATGHATIGQTLLASGKPAEAEAELRRALAISTKALGGNHPSVAKQLADLAGTLTKQKKFADALAQLDRAHAIQLETIGADHPLTAYSLAGMGETHLGLRDYRRAVDELRRALPVIEAKMPQPTLVGSVRFALARALWGIGDHTAALDLAEKARATYGAVPARRRAAAEIDRWLAAHAKQ